MTDQERILSGTYIAARRICNEEGKTIAFVPAQCEYVKYCGGEEPHEVIFPWKYMCNGNEAEVVIKSVKERSSHVTSNDLEGFKTILRVCGNKNYTLMKQELKKIPPEKRLAFVKIFNKQKRNAYKYAEKLLPGFYLENDLECNRLA